MISSNFIHCIFIWLTHQLFSRSLTWHVSIVSCDASKTTVKVQRSVNKKRKSLTKSLAKDIMTAELDHQEPLTSLPKMAVKSPVSCKTILSLLLLAMILHHLFNLTIKPSLGLPPFFILFRWTMYCRRKSDDSKYFQDRWCSYGKFSHAWPHPKTTDDFIVTSFSFFLSFTGVRHSDYVQRKLERRPTQIWQFRLHKILGTDRPRQGLEARHVFLKWKNRQLSRHHHAERLDENKSWRSSPVFHPNISLTCMFHGPEVLPFGSSNLPN